MLSGVPRAVDADDWYNGFFIPKGAILHVVGQALSRDPKLYPHAEEYDPGRWLRPDSPCYKGPLSEHPRLEGYSSFGQGLRTCPGAVLTEAELLVACSALLQSFVIKKATTSDGIEAIIDPFARDFRIIGGPSRADVMVEARSPTYARRVTQTG